MIVRREVSVPDANFLRVCTDLKSGGGTADWVSALIVAMDLLYNACGKKKFVKRIFLVTNGRSKADLHGDQLKTVATQLARLDIALVVIGVGFKRDGGDDPDEEEDDEDDDDDAAATCIETPAQRENEKALLRLCRETGGESGAMRFNDLKGCNVMKSKSVQPTSKYRGDLRIGEKPPHRPYS